MNTTANFDYTTGALTNTAVFGRLNGNTNSARRIQLGAGSPSDEPDPGRGRGGPRYIEIAQQCATPWHGGTRTSSRVSPLPTVLPSPPPIPPDLSASSMLGSPAPSAERRAPSAERRHLSMLTTHRREVSVGAAIVALAVLLAVAAPGYFSRENLSDLFLASLPVLIVALGATLVILTGEIDISVGSVFAICGVLAGVSAKAGVPMSGVLVVACAGGAALGALNGSLVAYLRLPSIVVTLATMVALRDALSWTTEGAWVQDLPARFQWFGLSQSAYPTLAPSCPCGLLSLMAWGSANVAAGRAIYATGSNPDAARLAGFDTRASSARSSPLPAR